MQKQIILMMVCEYAGAKTKAWFDRVFEFYPAINIEHRTERMNAFVSLVFGNIAASPNLSVTSTKKQTTGYSVYALLYQSARNGALRQSRARPHTGLLLQLAVLRNRRQQPAKPRYSTA